MAKLPTLNGTVEAIDEHYEKTNEDWRRPHLGASLIGSECQRYIWLTHKWAFKPDFPGRILRLFETGKVEEERILNNLKSIGVEISDTQTRVEAFGGHFGGSLDGVGIGFVEAPKAKHVIECKTANDRQYNLLLKKGVKRHKPEHYAQMQIYMRLLKIDRAVYIVKNKNDDNIYLERIKLDAEYADDLIDLGRQLIFSNTAPKRIGDADSDKCKWCSLLKGCHGERVHAEFNCRTCIHSMPGADGQWICGATRQVLSLEEQKQGCSKHLFSKEVLPNGIEIIRFSDEEAEFRYKAKRYINKQGSGKLVPVQSGTSS